MSVKSDFESSMEQPRSSGKKWFACGGIGCILVLLLCGGGIAGIVAMIWPAVNTIAQEVPAKLMESQPLIDAVGEPITVGTPVQKGQEGEAVIIFQYPVSGPEGSGTATANVRWKSFSEWSIDSLTVDVDEQTIDVLASEEVELDIDDGKNY